MDNDEILIKMHKLHLLLADELKRICEKNDISYFMVGGTMLGAVRHKGFIPWDDDMDFGMTRDDFERFLVVAEKELDNKIFYLQTDRKEFNYPFTFAKLRLQGTKIIESFSEEVNVHNGIYIDIFPVDNVEDNKIKAFFQYKFFWFYRNLLWVKCGYGSKERKKTIGYQTAKLLSSFFSIEHLKHQKHKMITCCKNNESKSVVMSDSPYGLKIDTLLRKWIRSLTLYHFEGRVYPGIAAYDEYLKHYYKDYMQLPPLEKRNHHGRLDVDFGQYF